MTPWLVGIVAGAVGLLSARVLRSGTAGMIIAAAAVALGAILIAFNYDDAQRAALGEARLEGADLASLARRQVRCSRVEWHCERASRDGYAFFVPFGCGKATQVSAAFYDSRTDCANLPREIAGYLLDANEAGGGSAKWVLQVGAKPRTFPGVLAWLGVVLIVIGVTFPRLRSWAAKRASRD